MLSQTSRLPHSLIIAIILWGWIGVVIVDVVTGLSVLRIRTRLDNVDPHHQQAQSLRNSWPVRGGSFECHRRGWWRQHPFRCSHCNGINYHYKQVWNHSTGHRGNQLSEFTVSMHSPHSCRSHLKLLCASKLQKKNKWSINKRIANRDDHTMYHMSE